MDKETRPVREVVAAGAGWMVGFGVLRMLAGVVAMAVPFVSGVATGLVIGALLVVAGIAHMVQAFRAEQWGAGALGFLTGLLAIVGGVLMFAFPVAAVAALSTVAMAYLLLDGGALIALSLRMRPLSGWGWTLAAGVVSILAGLWLLSMLPLSALYAVGLLIGANMLVGGAWTVAVGFQALPARRERAQV